MAKRKKSRVEAARHKQDMSRLPDKFDFNGVRIQSGVAVESRSPFRVSKYHKEDNRRLAANNQYQARSSTDWRTIENDKEKYAAYLCSREWCERREKVRERSGGTCERCKALPMDACHHLSYERKYNESLEDLQAICNACHEFTHGKSDLDPAEYGTWTAYVADCKFSPVPWGLAVLGTEFMWQIKSEWSLLTPNVMAANAIVSARNAFLQSHHISNCKIHFDATMAMSAAMLAMDSHFGMDICLWIVRRNESIPEDYYDWSLQFFHKS